MEIFLISLDGMFHGFVAGVVRVIVEGYRFDAFSPAVLLLSLYLDSSYLFLVVSEWVRVLLEKVKCCEKGLGSIF